MQGFEAAGAPEEEFVIPTYGQDGDMNLIELKGREFNDPAWDE